jgi:hypothetical protein
MTPPTINFQRRVRDQESISLVNSAGLPFNRRRNLTVRSNYWIFNYFCKIQHARGRISVNNENDDQTATKTLQWLNSAFHYQPPCTTSVAFASFPMIFEGWKHTTF